MYLATNLHTPSDAHHAPAVTVQLVPLAEGHVRELQRIRATPEVWATWGEPADHGPEGGVTCFAIVVDARRDHRIVIDPADVIEALATDADAAHEAEVPEHWNVHI